MGATTYDFIPNTEGKPYIEQGATFDVTLACKDESGNPVDLTSYTARMQVRASKVATTVLLELSTTNGRLVLGGPAGTIQIVLSATDTAAITWRRGVYDLELVSAGGTVTRLFQGTVEIDPEVTREEEQ